MRDTNAELGAGAKLVLTEKLLTHGDQVATSNMKVELKGDDSSVQVISRSVAQDNSKQIFNPLVIGEAQCRGHVQCDAILMGDGQGDAPSPASRPPSEDALLVHEAAIGKIAGDQITEAHDAGPHRGRGRSRNPGRLPELRLQLNSTSPQSKRVRRNLP